MFLASISRQSAMSSRRAASTLFSPRFCGRYPHIFIERSIQDRLPGEEGGNLRPLFRILVVPEIEEPGFGGFIILGGPRPAVVDRELLKVGENGDGQIGRPGITPYLVSGIDTGFDIYGGPLHLDEEFPLLEETKAVVGTLDLSLHIDRILSLTSLLSARHSCL